jgi:hypothetical protein
MMSVIAAATAKDSPMDTLSRSRENRLWQTSYRSLTLAALIRPKLRRRIRAASVSERLLECIGSDLAHPTAIQIPGK